MWNCTSGSTGCSRTARTGRAGGSTNVCKILSRLQKERNETIRGQSDTSVSFLQWDCAGLCRKHWKTVFAAIRWLFDRLCHLLLDINKLILPAGTNKLCDRKSRVWIHRARWAPNVTLNRWWRELFWFLGPFRDHLGHICTILWSLWFIREVWVD